MKTELQTKEIIPGCEEITLKGNKIGCLLIHGFRSCPFEMKEYAKYLNSNGFYVKTVLLPGHGTNPKDLINVRWQNWFEATELALEELKQNCNHIFVSGLSTGGSLALYLATKHKIDGVIALAPGLFLKQKKAVLSHILKYFWKFKNIKSDPDISVKVESRVYYKVPISIISELLNFFRILKSKLHLIKVPVLLIYSNQDHVVEPKSSKIIYNKVSSKQKKMIELKHSYHILTMDIEKDQVFDESVRFIHEVLAS